MQTNLHKIRELISRSKLPPQDQDNLVVAFSLATDSELEPVVKLFSENHEWIEKISANYKSKQKVVSSQDQNLWQQIIHEEESQLKELEG
jgi:hypothetical protein